MKNNQQLYSLDVTTENSNPLIRWFFKWKFNKAVRMLEATEDDIILDFGCGEKYLQKHYENLYVLNYDKNPKVSDMYEEDYIGSYTTKVFAFDVLEHLSNDEIHKTLNNFKRMNPNYEMIVVTSYETWVWRLLRKMLGLPNLDKEHLSTRDEIISICKEHDLEIIEQSNFLWLSYIYKLKSYT